MHKKISFLLPRLLVFSILGFLLVNFYVFLSSTIFVSGFSVFTSRSISSLTFFLNKHDVSEMQDQLVDLSFQILKNSWPKYKFEYEILPIKDLPSDGNLLVEDGIREPRLFLYFSEAEVNGEIIKTLEKIGANQFFVLLAIMPDKEDLLYQEGLKKYYNREQDYIKIINEVVEVFQSYYCDEDGNLLLNSWIANRMTYNCDELKALLSVSGLYYIFTSVIEDMALRFGSKEESDLLTRKREGLQHMPWAAYALYLNEKHAGESFVSLIGLWAILLFLIFFIIIFALQFFRLNFWVYLDQELYSLGLRMSIKEKVKVILKNKWAFLFTVKKDEAKKIARDACHRYRDVVVGGVIKKDADLLMKEIVKTANNDKNVYGFLLGEFRIASGKQKNKKTITRKKQALFNLIIGLEKIKEPGFKENKVSQTFLEINHEKSDEKSSKKERAFNRRKEAVTQAKKLVSSNKDVDFDSLTYNQIVNFILAVSKLKHLNHGLVDEFIRKIGFGNILKNNSLFMQTVFSGNDEMLLNHLGVFVDRKNKTKPIYHDLSLPSALKIDIMATGQAVAKKALLVEAVYSMGIKRGNCRFIDSSSMSQVKNSAKSDRLIIFIRSHNKHAAFEQVSDSCILVEHLDLLLFKEQVFKGYQKNN